MSAISRYESTAPSSPKVSGVDYERGREQLCTRPETEDLIIDLFLDPDHRANHAVNRVDLR